VHGQPVRVRLVVLAPAGPREVTEDDVEPILEQVVRGMGTAARYDQPQVRIWPMGPSSAGFTPTFFRRVRRPLPAGPRSNWILVAGRAQAGARPVLLGLALWSDDPTTVGSVAVRPDEWNEVLHTAVVH
jgi:hypothetical protein